MEHLWALPRDIFAQENDVNCVYIMALSGAYFLKKTDDLSAIYDRILEQLKTIQHNQAEMAVDDILSALD